MRRLYSVLLRFYPRSVRSEFRDEMLDVFDEAAAGERRRGSLAYVRFCGREVSGLVTNVVLSRNAMKHLHLTLDGSLAGLLIGGALGAALMNRPYRSVAVLRATRQGVPEPFVRAMSIPVSESLPGVAEVVTSRGNLTNIIKDHNLYRSEVHGVATEALCKRMRAAIRIVSGAPDIVEVAFSYPDRFLAQQVTNDLASRIMAEHARHGSNMAAVGVTFMQSVAADAGRQWEKNLAAFRDAERTGKPTERAKLDADIAKQRYESLSVKLAQAKTREALERQRLGVHLDFMEPASLPPESQWSATLLALGGLSLGGLLGWLLAWALSLRLGRPVTQAS